MNLASIISEESFKVSASLDKLDPSTLMTNNNQIIGGYGNRDVRVFLGGREIGIIQPITFEEARRGSSGWRI